MSAGPRSTQERVADLRVWLRDAMKLVQHIATLPPNNVWVDAAPDRTRFLAIAPERTGPGWVTIVQNWIAGLK